MKLPIELKSNEFVVLITVDIDPKYAGESSNQCCSILPKGIKAIFKKIDGHALRLYCVCDNEEDFSFCLRQPGFKTTLL
ncbi:hypothetical protein ACYSNX_12385 [Myroides sp. LJL115]